MSAQGGGGEGGAGGHSAKLMSYSIKTQDFKQVITVGSFRTSNFDDRAVLEASEGAKTESGDSCC